MKTESSTGQMLRNAGNFDMEKVDASSEATWFIMKRWRVKKASYLKLCFSLLILSLFFERYFFITTVYKMKYYGYVLILMVIALTCILNMIIYRMRQEKQT